MAPDMEFDLESGPGIKGDEPIPEEDDAVDTVTCCAVSRFVFMSHAPTFS
jgi:hypothetical protein